MTCNCDMRTKLVGDGCSGCNPKLANQISNENAFDKWFDENGYDEQHRTMFNIVWNAAIENTKE